MNIQQARIAICMTARLATLFICCMALGISFSHAQDAAQAVKLSPSIAIEKTKKPNGDQLIRATLGARTENGRVLLKGFELVFLGGSDQSLELGRVKTNFKGVATLLVPGEKLPPLEEGMLSLGARFDGNDTLESSEEIVSTNDLTIETAAKEEDSIRSLLVKVYSTNVEGQPLPLAETDVIFYVPRMFSYLKIGEATLDSAGTAVLEFPLDLPGDSLGNIMVIAKIEEHDMFGNVEGGQVLPWGVPARLVVKESYRALWSKIAPTWMVVTLVVLLVGVWGHYAYAVYKMIRIKKEAQKLLS